MDNPAPQRARLAEIEGELAHLHGRNDLAMSAFKFDEANALQRRIIALDDERRAVVATLPEQTLPPEPPSGVMPALARRRRMGRARRNPF